MGDFIAALISFFLIGPLQNEIADVLTATRAPQEIVAQVTECAAAAGPAIIDRAVDDPWWAASSALSVWVGLVEPTPLLVEAAPGCDAAVKAAQPFLIAEE
jgi:hypothetical protein